MKLANDGKIPEGMLTKSLEECTNEVEQFVALHKADSENEKFPIMAFKKRESLKMVNPNKKD